MDIFKFINSKDIAAHLKKINYQFSPLEAMFLIHESRNISLKEKHEAYRELMELYPDCVVEQRRSDVKTQTLSEFLEELMRRQDLLIEECKKDEGGIFYFSSCFTMRDWAWTENRQRYSEVYSSYQECLTQTANDEDVIKLKIIKKYIADNHSVELTVMPNGAVLNVNVYPNDPYLDYFEWMWIRIPTPFRRGDILCNVQEPRWGYRWGQTFVLDQLDSWDSKEMAANGFRDGKQRKAGEVDFAAIDRAVVRHTASGDQTDMCYRGYFQTDSGELYWDHEMTYLDLEYYRVVPTEQEAILTLMSNYLQGKVDGELFAKAYHIHLLREQLRNEEWALQCYTDEALRLAGLKEEKHGAK